MKGNIGRRERETGTVALCGAALLASVVIALCAGKYPVTLGGLFRVVFGGETMPSALYAVIFHIRLPRVAAAALIGAGLSAAGLCYQSLFNNPLVSPDLLGASAGAGFGAALGILAGFGPALISFGAFTLGLAAVAAALLAASRAKTNPALSLVLSGIIFSALFEAATSALKLIADTANELPSITYWLMGSLAGIRAADIRFAAIPLCAGLVILFLFRWQLTVVTTGEDEARSVGVSTRVVRAAVITGATLTTAASVSISGLVGWVGLVIPHAARMLTGDDVRAALPASMLLGASFLLVIDTLARTLTTAEIPLGILTAFLGAPFFIFLIVRRGHRS